MLTLLSCSRYGPNLLLNSVEGYHRSSVWQCLERGGGAEAGEQTVRDYDNSIVSGFQLATLAGPLCEEPLMGVCFSLETWDMKSTPQPAHQESLEEDSNSHDASVAAEAGGAQMESAAAVGAGPGLSRRRAEPGASTDCYGPFSGQLIATMKEACRHAFQARPQRLMAAMYTCEIMATAEVLGKTPAAH